MFKGETFVMDLAIKNSDGSAKDLTGAKIYLTVKNQYSEQDSSAVAQLWSPSNGVVIVGDPKLGNAEGTIPPIATYGLPGDSDIVLVYDAKVIDGSGNQSICDSGTITVHPAVTRAIS